MKIIQTMTLLLLLSLGLTGCGPKQQETNGKAASQSDRYARASHINVQLGLGYLQKGQTTRAKQKLLLALKQAPKSAEANDAMAYFLEATGEKEDADKYYQRAIKLSNNQGAPLNNYGTFLCREGKYKLADSYFRRAVKDKDYVNLADAYENAGLCALQLPNYKRAEFYFKQALAKDPERPNSLLELAEISYRKGQNKNAEKYLNRYRHLAKETPQSLYLNYRVATRLHKKKTAHRFAQQLMKQYPKSAQAKLYKFRKGYRVS